MNLQAQKAKMMNSNLFDQAEQEKTK